MFFLLFTFTALRSKLGKAGAFFDKPAVQRSTAWIGLMGFMIGMDIFDLDQDGWADVQARLDFFPGHPNVVWQGRRGFQCCHFGRRTGFPSVSRCNEQRLC